MKLPSTAHTKHQWRIHDIAYDFRLLDVWALPTPGGPEDFPLLVQWMISLDPTKTRSFTVRTLFEMRRRAGELLRWDAPEAGVGARVDSLRARLPGDLRDVAPGLDFQALPATTLFSTDDEFAAEVANKTVHGLLHLGWVEEGHGGYRGQLAVLVKPNGAFGEAYLAAIRPFRHLIVYPALVRAVGSYWQTARTGAAP